MARGRKGLQGGDLYHPVLRAYWGAIQKAVSNRATTKDLWAAVKDAAQQEGASLQGVTPFHMNALRSLAIGIRNSKESFEKASPTSPITSDMISTNINSNPLGTRNTVPMYQIRYQHNVVQDDEQFTTWRTSLFTGELPTTKEDLIAELDAQAELIAHDYGQEHVGIQNIEISVV